MKVEQRQQLIRGRDLHAEISSMRPIYNTDKASTKSIYLSYEDISALRAFLTCGDWLDAQKQAAKEGQKKAVAVLHGVTIFQKD